MNAKQYEFVMQYLQHKDKITAYTIAYNKRTSNYRAVESAANRLLQNPEIKQYIANMRESMYNEAMQEVQKELKTELLTVHRKREVLARIVNGEHSVIQNFKGKNCQVCTYFLYPTIREILQGIREDNRMAGHYPSPAVASTKVGKNAVVSVKAPAGKNARYIDSIPRLAQTPLPAGLARFAQNEEGVSQSRMYGTTNNKSKSPSGGFRGPIAPDTLEAENPQPSANIIPQSMSPLQGDRVKTAEGNSEGGFSQHPATNNKSQSPSGGTDSYRYKGPLAIDTPDVQNPQSTTYDTTISHNISPSGAGGVLASGTPAEPQSPTCETTISHNISPSGAGGLITPDTPQNPQHPATNNKLSPSEGSGLQAKGGTFAPDTPAEPFPTCDTALISHNISPLGAGGYPRAEKSRNQNPQSRTYGTNNKLSPSGGSGLQAEGGTLAPDTRETQNPQSHKYETTTIPQPSSPLQGDRGKTTDGNSEDDISQHPATIIQQP